MRAMLFAVHLWSRRILLASSVWKDSRLARKALLRIHDTAPYRRQGRTQCSTMFLDDRGFSFPSRCVVWGIEDRMREISRHSGKIGYLRYISVLCDVILRTFRYTLIYFLYNWPIAETKASWHEPENVDNDDDPLSAAPYHATSEALKRS